MVSLTSEHSQSTLGMRRWPLAERPTSSISRRIRAEYAEMPGLALTLAQAVRLFGLETQRCSSVLAELVATGYLRESDGRFLFHG